jgi:hypothetical protein
MRTSLISCFFALLLFSSKGNQFKLDSLQEYGLGFHWSTKQKRVEIPFELHANLVVIPIQLNASDTLRFLVDTGLGTTLLTDSLAFRNLGLKSIRKIDLLGLGEEKPIEAQVLIDVKIQVGQASASHQNLIYVSSNQLNLSDYVGTKIQGVLGYELFANAVVTIDYARQRLILRRAKQYHYSKRKGTRFPLEMVDNKPYIRAAQITSDQHVPLANRLLLDSGAGHVLFLDGNAVDSSMFHFSAKRVYLGKGLNGAILGNWGRVPQLILGSWTWKQVPAAFTFAQSTQQKIKSADLHGSLGGEFLRRFIVTFHYLDQYVVLKPIARQWRRQFDLGMSGLSFRAQGTTYQQFIVETIQANSPAEEAGIQVGDELWFINGMRASEYRLGDIYRMLRKKEGKKMEMVIKRGQNFHMISFTLRALF